MAKTLAQLLFDIATKAGIAETDPELIALTENQDVFKMTVPDKLVGGIESQLISIKDAKNNHPDIKSFYTASALDGVDKAILKVLEEYNDEPTKAELLAEKNTYNRLPLLVKKVREMESKKAGANKGDKAELQAQIDQLNNELRDEKSKVPVIQKEAEERVQSFKKDYMVRSMLQQYKTTFDELDPEVRATTLTTLLNKELQGNKAYFAFDEHDNFILLKEGGANYYDGDTNTQIGAKAFIEKTLSRNKLLKVNDQSSNGNGDNNNNGQQQRQQQQPATGGNGATQKNHTLSGLAQQAIKDLEKNASVSVMG